MAPFNSMAQLLKPTKVRTFVFLLKVEEFRIAVSELQTTDLRHALKIHRRLSSAVSEKQKEIAISLLLSLTKFPQFSDWKDLVKEIQHESVQKLINHYTTKYPVEPTPEISKFLFPPYC